MEGHHIAKRSSQPGAPIWWRAWEANRRESLKFNAKARRREGSTTNRHESTRIRMAAKEHKESQRTRQGFVSGNSARSDLSMKPNRKRKNLSPPQEERDRGEEASLTQGFERIRKPLKRSVSLRQKLAFESKMNSFVRVTGRGCNLILSSQIMPHNGHDNIS